MTAAALDRKRQQQRQQQIGAHLRARRPRHADQRVNVESPPGEHQQVAGDIPGRKHRKRIRPRQSHGYLRDIQQADREIGGIQPRHALEHEGRVVFQATGIERVPVGQRHHVSTEHEEQVDRQIAVRNPVIGDVAAAKELNITVVIDNNDSRGDATDSRQRSNVCGHRKSAPAMAPEYQTRSTSGKASINPIAIRIASRRRRRPRR